MLTKKKVQKQKFICTIFFAKPLSQSLFLHLHQSLYKEGLPLPSPLTSKLGKVGTFADTRYLATNNGCQQQIWRYYNFSALNLEADSRTFVFKPLALFLVVVSYSLTKACCRQFCTHTRLNLNNATLDSAF